MKAKKIAALVLAVITVFSLFPAEVFAEEDSAIFEDVFSLDEENDIITSSGLSDDEDESTSVIETEATIEQDYVEDNEPYVTAAISAPESISLNVQNLTLNVGDTYQLEATVLPEGAEYSLYWDYSDWCVYVDYYTGLITANDVGTSTITCFCDSNSGETITASCIVTVVQPVESVQLNSHAGTLYTGGTLSLNAAVTPENATNSSVAWSSDNEAVAVVDETGTVTGVSEGTAVIRAEANDGSGCYDTCTISVRVINEIVNSGTCGEHVNWTLTGSGNNLTLTISGYGEMSDFTETTIPWASYRAKIVSLVVEEGITYIGEYAFYSLNKLTDVSLPQSLRSIGLREYSLDRSYAFAGCVSLKTIDLPDNLERIGSYTFSGCRSLERICIPASVTSLGEYYTFSECSSLTEVIIPEGITSIGNWAFYGCSSLESIDLPTTVSAIGGGAFEECISLRSIIIPEGVQTLAETFKNCSSLTTVVLPESLVSIDGWFTFSGCSSLVSINIPSGVLKLGDYCTFSGCSSLEHINIPNGVTSVGYQCFYGCSSLTSIVIPDSVTSIGYSAFYGCSSLTSVVIGDGVTSIGDSAFYNCSSLTSIRIPDGVVSLGSLEGYSNGVFEGCSNLVEVWLSDTLNLIGQRTFYNCSSLTTITIPDGVTTIGSSAFRDCSSLRSVSIPNGVTSIEGAVFSGCSNLMNIAIPNSVTIIGESAFSGCSSLRSLSIPGSVTSIGRAAFSNCSNLTTVTISEGVTSIGESAFSGCSSLTSVAIPGGVTSLGSVEDYSYNNGVFQGCDSLTEVLLPDTLLVIGNDVFSGCNSLESITIPDSVTDIGSRAFSNCSSLTSIMIPDGVTSIGGAPFSGCNSLTSITIPDGAAWSVGSYEFSNYTNLMNVSLGNGVTSIGDGAFSGCTNLSSFTVGNGLANIGQYAFFGCSSLTSITIPGSVTSIGHGAFSGCSSLTRAMIQDGVTSIGNSVFSRCSSLTSITIPDSVTSIGDYAFSDCSSLTSITIPDSVTSIGDYAFNACISLESISIPDSVTSIGNSVLSLCSSLTSITIPDSVTSIGDYAFSGCSSLTSVTIPDNVISVGRNAFECFNLRYIVVPAQVASIGEYPFYNSDPDDHTLFVLFRGTRSQWDALNVTYSSNGVEIVCEASPTIPYIIDISPSSIGADVEWTEVSHASSYQVFYRQGNGSWIFAGTTANTQMTVTGLSSGEQYSFRVRAFVDGTWEQYSPNKLVNYIGTPSYSVSIVSNGIKITWSAVAGATQYHLCWREEGTSGTHCWITFNLSETIDFGLHSGSRYQLWVVAVDSEGNESGYTEKTLRWVAPPTISSAVNAANGITVSWSPVAGAEQYRLFYRVGTGSWVTAGTISDTSMTVQGLTSGTAYTFRVRACCNGEWSASSANKTITCVAAPSVTTSNTASGINLSWSAITGAAKYRVQYRTTSTSSWTTLTTITGTSYTVDESRLTSGTQYVFRVQAISSDNVYSNAITRTRRWVAPPTITSAVNAVNGITVSWSSVAGAEQYRLFYRVGTGSWVTAGTISDTSMTVQGLTSGTAYTFRVRACCNGEWSASSTNKTITCVAAPSVTASNTASGINLSWSAITGAAKYRVQYRSTSTSSWTTLTTITGTSYTVADSRLTSGTQYEFRVQAITSGSVYSSCIVVKKQWMMPPQAAATNTVNGINLSWSAVSGAAKYRVQYRQVGASSWTTAGTTTGTSYTVAGSKLTSGTQYEFRVQAISSGGVYSSYNAVKKRWMAAPAVTVSNTTSGINLSWSAITGAAKYRVQYRQVGASSWTTAGTITGTSYTVAGSKLTSGTQYEFRVQAISSDGVYSSFSAVTIRRTP